MPKKNWDNLPDNFFIGKFVKYGFPFYCEKRKRRFHELAWVKVIKIESDWIVGIIDSELTKGQEFSAGWFLHFLKSDIEDVMGQ